VVLIEFAAPQANAVQVMQVLVHQHQARWHITIYSKSPTTILVNTSFTTCAFGTNQCSSADGLPQ
jgi:hypothetical protein